MNDAGVAPAGVIPIQQPMMQERSDVIQYAGNPFQVCSTTRKLILAVPPRKLNPSSIVRRISPMPNRPMTAIRKSKPLSNSVNPNVNRNCPVMESSPTAASAKPIIIAAIVLNGGSLLKPTKLQNARKYTANFSAGPNCNAKLATRGATSVIMMTANSAPTKEEVKAAVSASPALPCCAIGSPSKVVPTDQGSPGMLNRIEVSAPPNKAPQ